MLGGFNLCQFGCLILLSLFILGACQILGTPTREEIRCMNPNYTEFKFPQIKAHPWHKVSETYLVDVTDFSPFHLFVPLVKFVVHSPSHESSMDQI